MWSTRIAQSEPTWLIKPVVGSQNPFLLLYNQPVSVFDRIPAMVPHSHTCRRQKEYKAQMSTTERIRRSTDTNDQLRITLSANRHTHLVVEKHPAKSTAELRSTTPKQQKPTTANLEGTLLRPLATKHPTCGWFVAEKPAPQARSQRGRPRAVMFPIAAALTCRVGR